MSEGLNMSRRIRRTPYTNNVQEAGVRGFTVVNHMLLPKAYQPSVEEDYWHLREHVQLWDVSCQRQVQVTGPDAKALIQLMTPRNISRMRNNDCLYVPIIDAQGGLINDPVLIKLTDDKYWLSIADSDVLLYAKGIAYGKGFDVDLCEPDVYPLAIQGPKAEALLCSLFGDSIADIGFFKYGWISFQGTKQLIARSGYSRQGGFEIYLEGAHLGPALWQAIWEAGQAFNITPGCPNLIERIEGGLFSYGNEMTSQNNPFEVMLGKYCVTDGSIDYIGLPALQKIAASGSMREIRGILFDGGPCPTCSVPWPVMLEGQEIGTITSAIWSPRLERNVGLAIIENAAGNTGKPIEVIRPDAPVSGSVSPLPFA